MRKIYWLAIMQFIIFSCSKGDKQSQETTFRSSSELFQADKYPARGTVFTRDVSNMPLAHNSDAIAAYMPKMPSEYLPEQFKPWLVTGLNTTSFNIPIYVVNSNDSQQTYAEFDSGDPRVIYRSDLIANTTGRIPFPEYAVPAGGGDKSLAVYDVGTGLMREYFHVVKNAEGVWRFAASGYYQARPGLQGLAEDNYYMQLTTGSSAVVGMLNPLSQIGIEEARAGEIHHALSFTIADAGKGYSFPAKQGDGRSDNPNAPLQGQWFRIRPDVNLETLGLRPFTLVLAKATQRYGGYAADRNAFCHAFNTEHPINEIAAGKPDPWAKGGDIYEKYGNLEINDFPWHLTQWAPVDWGK
ncbi:MAG: hypothetical protein Q4G08_04655 [Capnocytophaga sp.]|nr:hypothetical protein [Capnocytophaga sp.]